MRAKHFNRYTFSQWFDALIKEGFINDSDSERVFHLKTPLKIVVTKKAVSSLRRRYRRDVEIGGLLLAEPIRVGSDNVLLVDGIKYVRNVSDDPGNEYQSNFDSYKKSVLSCLKRKTWGKRYLPLQFHTHPRDSDRNDVMAYFNMSTSDADEEAARPFYIFTTYKRGSKLDLPSALCIVTTSGGVFIGVYGGGVTPDGFRSYSEKLLGKTAKSVANWGVESDSDFLKVMGFMAEKGINALASGMHKKRFHHQSLAMRLVTWRKQTTEDNDYFTLVKNEDATINLPKVELKSTSL